MAKSKVRNYFIENTTTFLITTLGRKTYLITTSEYVSKTYNNTIQLSFNVFVQQLMRWSGNSEDCEQLMYRPSLQIEGKVGFPNPNTKPLGTLSRDLHIHKLFPRDELSRLLKRFVDCFYVSLT